ncbi:uncharacterized protein LOC144153883 [Haemaphysalis longicornis]
MAYYKLAVILVFLTSSSAAENASSGNCSFADEDLEHVINRDLIAKLPAVRSGTKHFFGQYGTVLTTEGKIEGLDSLRLFGTLLTFCRNGTRMVQFDLVNERPLSIEVTHGPEELITTAGLVRFTVLVEAQGSGQGLRLFRKAEVPVTIAKLWVGAARSEESIIQQQFRQAPTDFWYQGLYPDLEELFIQFLS